MSVVIQAPADGGGDVQILESAVVRFAGDSGDGMQLTGSQFTTSTALAGSDLATFPDFPAEIRAPAGTTFGVSAFQINFGAKNIRTVGDRPDVLVAMNPAALKVNLDTLRPGGLLVVDSGSFTKRNLQKAGYEANPLEDDSLHDYQLIDLDISKLTLESVKPFGLGNKDALRCKNMWTLGLVLWMFSRKRQPVVDWLNKKFAKLPDVAGANVAALNAGHAFGETAELSATVKRYQIGAAHAAPGLYRTVTGSQALSWGIVAGGELAGLDIVLGSYPITPASPILHTLSGLKDLGVVTFQAEDEIAAIGAAIGASYGGALGVTSSSGPGIALKTEALGLAISTELPVVVINSQRGGPSTGLPTKTEQSDLYQAVYGRNGDAPIPVIATRSPGDCFDVAIEACRLAVKYMTPVMLLTDGFIANAAEPWAIPDVDALEPFKVAFAEAPADGADFNPFLRDADTLARNWAVPGTPGTEHRIGGLEKSFDTGHISYDPENHQKMTDTRMDKIAGIARDIPAQTLEQGTQDDTLVVVGWGSTFGPIAEAVRIAREDGLKVAHLHLRYLNPFPANLGDLLRRFPKVLVPEMNAGQLKTVLRDTFLIDARPLNKVSGQPFRIEELLTAIRAEVSA
ncbi:2-oxoacid:acceptor oxidoreductase subunit alpha [Eilatimonas milleporae]|uniref:2-oxoglutarate ferredoxin oxidoreductase subunit alpha n=1 Tax=Eilatimonas milleporae TaxID=911205 RepID=A0A3M0CGU2_9PROT|nr:2-oxoacid:acceptor oxidoreductase subunit alpha [Eilatimonas milleporae]RMB07740.1 2-oxoglutarate ferredoxin oxidoreductase subunit alpha [Eilatimonas milleporae]